MPGRLFLTRDAAKIADEFGGARLPDDNFATGVDVAPGQNVLVLDDARNFRAMRWGMILSGRVNARKRPVMETIINARSETVFSKTAFKGVRRAIVPCDGWYEWTGEKRRKTRWRIASRDGSLILFAAVFDEWSGPGGVVVPQVATVTCPPNGDVRDIHHRMGVILKPDQVDDWLDGADVPMDPAPDGSLTVEVAEGMA